MHRTTTFARVLLQLKPQPLSCAYPQSGEREARGLRDLRGTVLRWVSTFLAWRHPLPGFVRCSGQRCPSKPLSAGLTRAVPAAVARLTQHQSAQTVDHVVSGCCVWTLAES